MRRCVDAILRRLCHATQQTAPTTRQYSVAPHHHDVRQRRVSYAVLSRLLRLVTFCGGRSSGRAGAQRMNCLPMRFSLHRVARQNILENNHRCDTLFAMKRLWLMMLVAVIGICGGVAVDEGLHAVRNRKSQPKDRDSSELFQHRLRCKTVADDYAKQNSDDSSALLLERVDFSPSRRSCIASFTRWTTGKQKLQRCNCFVEIHDYEAVDLLSGETLYSGQCVENDPDARTFCGNGRDMKLGQERSDALESALASKE